MEAIQHQENGTTHKKCSQGFGVHIIHCFVLQIHGASSAILDRRQMHQQKSDITSAEQKKQTPVEKWSCPTKEKDIYLKKKKKTTVLSSIQFEKSETTFSYFLKINPFLPLQCDFHLSKNKADMIKHFHHLSPAED